MIDFGIDLKKKDASVNLQLDPAFRLAVPVLKTAWIMYGAECVVTSGKDGKHSVNSAHYLGRAVDLRHWNLPVVGGVGHIRFGQNLAKALVQSCGALWYVVLEASHYHVEFAPPGKRPNIAAWREGQFFYQQQARSAPPSSAGTNPEGNSQVNPQGEGERA
jgi:hypothetical protein